MDELTHERCSELLARHVRGELAGADEARVRAHLEACTDCRAEERALQVLLEEHAPLDDVERARLHRTLSQELFATRANADVTGTVARPRTWKRWIVPAASSAAALLVGVLVLSTGGLPTTGEDADSGAGAQFRAPAPDEGGGGGDSAVPAAGDDDFGRTAEQEALSAEADAAVQDGTAGPTPEFHHDPSSRVSLQFAAAGRRSDVFREFAEAYEASDVPELADEFLDVLAEAAGGAGAEVRECAATLPDDGTLLPAYGALGEHEGRDALVLGFVTSNPGSRDLDRAVIWVWERGSCSQPIDTVFEEI